MISNDSSRTFEPRRRREHTSILRTAVVAVVLILGSGWPVAANAAESSESKGEPKIAAAHVGLAGHYKLGSWTPIVVEVSNAADSKSLHIDVTTSDNDGVATTASVPIAAPPAEGPTVIYTQVGRIRSPIRVKLADGDDVIDELTLQPSAKSKPGDALVPIPSTGELIVSLGSAKYGLKDAFPHREGSAAQAARALVEVENVADLPAEWFGYDGADVVVLAANDGQLCRALANDKPRFAALARWVELGGRLVILCSGPNCKPLLEPGGPLATFAPGKLADIINLPDATALENAAARAPAIGGAAIRVPRFVDVEGTIEAYAGRRPTDLPLVVRTPRGFGEIAFVTLEFREPPLAEWPGRAAFLQALLRPYLSETTSAESSQQLATSGITDLSAALRQQLGRSFSSVANIGFPAVTGLAIAYLLILGPLDYFVIHRWLRRPRAAWITFPLIVLAFAAAALALDNWSKGSSGTRVNQLSLVDIDTISGQSRGSLWSSLFTPNADRFDLSVKLPPSPPDTRRPNENSPGRTPDTLFSWWGLPGTGIGGMQAAGSDLGIIQHGYSYGPELASLEDLPILASGTKSLIARWAVASAERVGSELSDAEDLLAGFITNDTGITLQNARLFYGSWGYQLGNLKPGQRIDITDVLSPRNAKTIITRDTLVGPGATAAQAEGRAFVAEQASPAQVLNLMMFYDTAGGLGFAHLPHRCQSQIDMSRQLELGRAVLVADVAAAGATIVDNDTNQPLTGAAADNTTVYRFILPIKKSPPSDKP